MNAKEQVIQELKEKILNTIRFGNENYIQQLESIIDATEAAIFDVPSEEEIERESLKHFTAAFAKEGFKKGCNFILNYKPTL